MTRYSRAEIGLRPARGGPGPLQLSRVEGIALHWPAMSKPLTGVQAVMAALRGWQNYHMDDLGWSDIAYQVAVDQDGNRYELRGLATQSGANGGTDVNERFGAALLVVAPGEEPTMAMVREVRNVIADHRRMFPRSHRIVGHGDIRPEPTACPGAAVSRGIRAGVFDPTTTDQSEEDDFMASIDEPLNAHDPKGRPSTANVTVREALSALVISLTEGDKAAKDYLERAAKSAAPKG
jgi:hypothetical protein